MADNATLDAPGLTLNEIPGGELPSADPVSSDALDALLRAADPETTELPPEIKAKEKAAPAVTPTTETPVVPVVETPVASPKTETPAATADDLDSIELPPYTKPKTAESFSKIKELARSKIVALEKERNDLKESLEKAKTDSSTLTEQEKSELSELRTFRQKVDVEADPEFKKFDDQVTTNEAVIYSKLKAAGFKDDTIARIKEIGLSDVDWDALKDKIHPNLRRFIDAKIVENEDAAEKKILAINKAKDNAAEYVKTRGAEMARTGAEAIARAEAKVQEIRPKSAPWLVKKEIPAAAKPEEKAALEAHNTFVASIEQDIKDAVADDSPEMRGILALAYAQYRHASLQLTGVDKKIEALTTAHKTELAKVQADLKTANEFIERIKKSSPSKIKDSQAPAPGSAKAKTKTNVFERGEDALDRALAEVQSAGD